MPDALSGARFMEWLEEQGVVPAGRRLRRVVIDAMYDGVVTIFWEELGTDVLTGVSAPDELLNAGLIRLEPGV